MALDRNLHMGMVGGGPGAFIGEVHRKAARMDGGIQLVAGAFSSDPEKSQQTGRQLYLDPGRVYDSYEEMIEHEQSLPAGERIDFVSITTPNNWHFPIARDFLQAGFHVVCDKPMTLDVQEAKQLKSLVDDTGLLFGLTHNYTGYPMVKLARDMIKDGDLGEIRKVVVQYPQGWLATALEKTGDKQASWRTDPKQSGGAGAMGDIGTHAENLTEYLTRLKMSEVCADLTTFVEGRPLDDDGNVLFRLNNGARGILHCSQISVGEENNLAIFIYGTKKGLEWHQEHPNYLHVKQQGRPTEIWARGADLDYLAEKSPAAGRATRIPSGHPEAFLEAFANVYQNFADTLRARLSGETPDPIVADYPDVNDGLRGMLFIETVLDSAKSDKKWTRMHT